VNPVPFRYALCLASITKGDVQSVEALIKCGKVKDKKTMSLRGGMKTFIARERSY
jgi:hypothetical protein